MNTKIIESIVLGSVLLVMQPAAMAGKCMEIGVANAESCTLGDFYDYEVTGTEGFRDAVSQNIGRAANLRSGCPGAHVSIAPSDVSNCEHGVPPS